MRRFVAAVAAVGIGLSVGTVVQSQAEPVVSHVSVRAGEGLWQVAARLCPGNVGPQYTALQQANPWYTVGLHPGTVLHLPEGSCPAVSTTTTSTTTTSTTSTTEPPAELRFPTTDSVGVPDGWTPTTTITVTGDWTVRGGTIENVRYVGTGDSSRILVRGNNVTFRNVEFVNTRIQNSWGPCFPGLLIEDSTFTSDGTVNLWEPAVQFGGWTARRILVEGRQEGLRIGGRVGSPSGCGPVVVEDSYVHIEQPLSCTSVDWHGDAMQGFRGDNITVRDTVLVLDSDFANGCGGTSPFFYPNQENTFATVDGLIVAGGGYSFRLGTDGDVNDLYVVDESWEYRPVNVTTCAALDAWDAHLATLDGNGQPIEGAPIDCAP